MHSQSQLGSERKTTTSDCSLPSVLDLHLELDIVLCVWRQTGDLDPDLALFCEAHRIQTEVGHNLPQKPRVGVDAHMVELRVKVKRKLEVLFVAHTGKRTHCILEARLEAKVISLHVFLFGLDRGEVLGE